eukprot:6201027-Pleurochrysis_carterae.AAC.2
MMSERYLEVDRLLLAPMCMQKVSAHPILWKVMLELLASRARLAVAPAHWLEEIAPGNACNVAGQEVAGAYFAEEPALKS